MDDCAAQCWNTLPIPWKQDQEPYELRFVEEYAMDGTDLPCYILWPERTEDQSFWCLDAWKGIGFNWTNVVSSARLELSTSSMPSVIVHNALSGQRQSKPSVFLPAILWNCIVDTWGVFTPGCVVVS